MQYNQPYGISDPNAPYINGNPSTGTAGSIPPAASIEYPQREIANFISDAGISPSNSDLHQLAKSVQTGHVIYGHDGGAINIISISPTPAVLGLVAGMYFFVKINNNITGPSVLQISGLGGVRITKRDGSDLANGDLIAGQMALFSYDGTYFQYISSSANQGTQIYLLTTLTFYLNPVTGDDNAYDGTAATVSGVHGPWKTLYKIASVISKYNLNGQSILVYMADGTYALGATNPLFGGPGYVSFPAQNGSGSVQFLGNHSNPDNVSITRAAGSGLLFMQYGTWVLDGMKIDCPTLDSATGDAANCMFVSNTALVIVKAVYFNRAYQAHMESGINGVINPYGPIHIKSGGNAAIHIFASTQGQINFPSLSISPNCILTVEGPVTFASYFAYAVKISSINGYYYGGTVGAANVTGQRYTAQAVSVIDANGGGASAFPGTIAGTVSNGGVYLP
jgi:hypothetical protein